MANFTTLINRAHRRYIDKYLKKRSFGACEACGTRTLLVRFVENDGIDSCNWDLCESCYDQMINGEN